VFQLLPGRRSVKTGEKSAERGWSGPVQCQGVDRVGRRRAGRSDDASGGFSIAKVKGGFRSNCRVGQLRRITRPMSRTSWKILDHSRRFTVLIRDRQPWAKGVVPYWEGVCQEGFVKVVATNILRTSSRHTLLILVGVWRRQVPPSWQDPSPGCTGTRQFTARKRRRILVCSQISRHSATYRLNRTAIAPTAFATTERTGFRRRRGFLRFPVDPSVP
jgi:hypothetical protein